MFAPTSRTLQKKYQNNKKGSQSGWFKDRAAHSALKKALAQGQWDEAIRHGLQVLRANPWDIPTLTQMATAAKESGDSDSELCYLKAALTKAPKDPTCNRMAAIALDELGLVNQAIVFWQRVAEALPKDKEAKEAISAFQVGAKARGVARQHGLTAQEQEEMVRQREIQQQEENGPAAEDSRGRGTGPATEDSGASRARVGERRSRASNPTKRTWMIIATRRPSCPGCPRLRNPPTRTGTTMGLRRPNVRASGRKKIDLLSLAVMLVTWLIMLLLWR